MSQEESENMQAERQRLMKNMDVLRTRQTELSEKLKEAEKTRKLQDQQKKVLGDKEAELKEREKQLEAKIKKLHDPRLLEQIAKLQEEASSMKQQNESLDATVRALESQVQEQCEKTKAKSKHIEEAASRIKQLLEDSEAKEQLIKSKELQIAASEQKAGQMLEQMEKLREILAKQKEEEEREQLSQRKSTQQEEKEKESGNREQQKSLIEEKDRIIAKHEESVIYYEETIMELKKAVQAKMSEIEELKKTSPQGQKEFFPTSTDISKRPASERSERSMDDATEEIVYIKFDISTIDTDDSEMVREYKQENAKLREELQERVELLKRERKTISLIEERALELACQLEEKSQEIEKLNLSLRRQDSEFRKWKRRSDEIESINRDLEVKLARTQASLKIALQKFNQASHQIQVQISQLKDQQLQEKLLNEKIGFLAQAKQKAEGQAEQFHKKLKQATSKINYLENFLFQQKQELNTKEGLLYRMKSQFDQQQSMLKSTELKLRQVNVTKVKDWQKKFKTIEQEKKVLEDMVRASKLQQQEKEAEAKKLERKVKRLEKQLQQKVQSERTEALSTSPSRKSSEHTNDKLRKIKEVEENLESTHKSRNIPALREQQDTLPQIAKVTTKSRKQSQDLTPQSQIYETPPIKKQINLLGSPVDRNALTIGTTTPRTIIRRNSRPQSTQRSDRNMKASPSVGGEGGDAQLESARGPGMSTLMQETEGISKYSQIRAARLKKASQSPFWSQQLDTQYDEYLQTITSTKNNSLGVRKVLFQGNGGGEDSSPLIMRGNYLQRFKPS